MRLLALVSEGRVAMSRDDLARQRDGPTAGSPNTAWVWDSPIFSMGAANFPTFSPTLAPVTSSQSTMIKMLLIPFIPQFPGRTWPQEITR